MIWTRREFLAACAAALPALRTAPVWAHAGKEPWRLGVVDYSYHLRLAADRAAGKPGLNDPLAFVEYCHQRGAGGVQLDLGLRDPAYTRKLRAQLETYGMYLEGSSRLPRGRADVERFTGAVRTARDAGADVLRTVLLGGRRYEVLDSAAAFRKAAEQAYRSLTLAEPIAARHGLRLAIENHKDWRTGELLAMLRRLASRHVGVCVDTGNSIALLEDPLEVVEAYAPWAYSTHLKDMAVAEYTDGFLLAEVPLGEGILDLPKVVDTLRRAQPEVRFNLEMITRDPLRVPCLSPRYWATLAAVPGRDLAHMLSLVRQRPPRHPLPRISGLAQPEQLAAEEENVRKSLAYARQHLGL